MKSTISQKIKLTNEQISFYRENGYIHLKSILPESVLKMGRQIYHTWLPTFIDQWRKESLLKEPLQETDLFRQFTEAWFKSGKPHFRRQPFKNLINSQMFDLFKNPYILSLAEQLLGTTEIAMHGVYNGRAQPPDADWATPGWHQDAQFWDEDFGEERDKARMTHVLTLWFPLHYVDENSGCLQLVSLKETNNQLFEHRKVDYDNTGFLGVAPEIPAQFEQVKPKMEAGDVIAFCQRNLHRASPNHSGQMRYSYDLRYEAIANRTTVGKKYGFIAQCLADPSRESSKEEWVEKQKVFVEWEQSQKTAR